MVSAGDVNISERDLRALRRQRPGMFRIVSVLVIAAIVIATVTSVINLQSADDANRDMREARRELVLRGAPWAKKFTTQQEEYRGWLTRHGLAIEVTLFDTTSRLLFQSAAALNSAHSQANELGFFQNLYVSLHFATLRVSFLAIAALRLWLTALLAGGVWGYLAIRVYRRRDILGETGNGRMFFSGARASFDKLAAPGTPDGQITGLACPAMLPLSVAKASPIGRVLERYGALNETTTALAAIIGKHDSWPSFVAPHGEQELLDKAFRGCPLPHMAVMLLDRALALQRHYRISEKRDEVPATAGPSTIPPNQEGVYRDSEVAMLMQRALHRVLTPSMRVSIAELSSSELATLILAHEAGKAMAFGYEGGKWVRRSNYPQLCARSVLHSIASFADEYDFHCRAMLRQALVYGSRQSVFGPVRMPVDMAPSTVALRQWSEVFLACPHNLQSVADEVELYGLVRELHQGWLERFVDITPEKAREQCIDCYCSPSNIVVLPLPRVVRIFREYVSATTRRRLEELVLLVSQRQQLRALAEASGQDEIERTVLHSYERVFAPLQHEQLVSLADIHELTLTDLREWSSLRVVLNAFGWLGRRVGDYSVPESSVIFAVIAPEDPTTEVNVAGLLGKRGMVALRATRLQERWGRSWRKRFTSATRITMAETLEEFHTRLLGKEEELPEIPDAANSSISS